MDKKLTPGAEVRVFRAGDLTQPVGGGLLVPDDETQLAIRHLEPGDYVAVDSCGQEVPFTVPTGDDELDTTFVDVKGAKALPEPNSDPLTDADLEELYEAGVLERPVEEEPEPEPDVPPSS
jgi:hypothetical protein